MDASGLGLRVDRTGSTVRVVAEGDLDAHSSRYLERVGVEALDQDGVDLLVLDGAAVTHVGSHGLATLIELSRVAHDQNARFHVENPSRVLSRLINLAGLNRLVAGSRVAGDVRRVRLR